MSNNRYKHINKGTSRRRAKKYKPASQKTPLWLKILVAVVIIAVVTSLLLYVLFPALLPALGIDYVAPGVTKTTPAPTPTPKPTPHPIETTDLSSLVGEVTMRGANYQWFSDVSMFGDNMLFAAGELVGGDALMTTLMRYDCQNDSPAERIPIQLENNHFMYPVFNDTWLCYLDAKSDGGGKIMCCKNDGSYSNLIMVKEVYTGHPFLTLSGNYLAWTERTGTSMDKLFLCDLSTMEVVTVQMFERSAMYGISKPFITGKFLVWADVDSELSNGQVTSEICTMNIETGDFVSYMPKTFVHDPKLSSDGTVLAWLDGNHGPETKLYVKIGDGEATVIAEGVVDFFMGDDFLAYQKDSRIWVSAFKGDNYQVSDSADRSILIGAGGRYVAWVCSAGEREILKQIRIPG